MSRAFARPAAGASLTRAVVGTLLVSAPLATVGCSDEQVAPVSSGPAGAGAATSTSGPTSGTGAGAGAAGGSGAAAGGGGAGGGASTSFETCSLVTEDNDGAAECATFSLPAKRGDVSLGTVHVFVKRVLATSARRGAVWLLSGGPGQSGVVWESLVPALQVMAPDLDIYLPDHRGTGRSDRLGCPDQEAIASEAGPILASAEVAPCGAYLEATWGERLATFNGTEAAYDIGELIELTREARDEQFVYGLSYGTQWAHRYLHLFPEQAAGVALDAICVPQCYFTDIDVWLQDLSDDYFALCAADVDCGGKLGPDPAAVATQAFAAIESSPCGTLDASTLPVIKNLLGQLFYASAQRSLVPAIVYRMQRCSSADQNALDHLVGFLTARFEEPLPVWMKYDSAQLGINVALVDNMPSAPPSLADLQAALDGYSVAVGESVFMRSALDVWPLYPKDAFAGALAERSGPMLLLHGTLDFIPESAVSPAGAHFDAPGQSYVLFEGAAHGTFFQTPVVPAGDCSAQMLSSFLASPGDEVDAACLAKLQPVSFAVDSTLSDALLGTTDAYEGDPGPFLPAAAAAARASPATRDLYHRVRRF